MVAHLHAGNAFTDRLHNATALVTEDDGKYAFRIIAGQREGIGVANTRGNDANPHFAGLGWHHVHFLDRQWLVRSPCDGGPGFDRLSHIFPSWVARYGEVAVTKYYAAK